MYSQHLARISFDQHACQNKSLWKDKMCNLFKDQSILNLNRHLQAHCIILLYSLSSLCLSPSLFFTFPMHLIDTLYSKTSETSMSLQNPGIFAVNLSCPHLWEVNMSISWCAKNFANALFESIQRFSATWKLRTQRYLCSCLVRASFGEINGVACLGSQCLPIAFVNAVSEIKQEPTLRWIHFKDVSFRKE